MSGSTVREIPLPAIARNTDPSGQRRLFQADPPPWRDLLTWIIGADPKAFATRIYGEENPKLAADNLGKILDPDGRRHFDVQWLDLVAAHFGKDAEEAIVRFVCERYGYLMPARKPDAQRGEDELVAIKKGLGEVARAVQELTKAVQKMEGEP